MVRHPIIKIQTASIILKIPIQQAVIKTLMAAIPRIRNHKYVPEMSGVSIITVKSITEKYSGSADFYEENLTFICKVILGKNI